MNNNDEIVKKVLEEIAKQFPNGAYVEKAEVRPSNINNTEIMSELVGILEELGVLINRESISRNNILGDFDVEKAKEILNSWR